MVSQREHMFEVREEFLLDGAPFKIMGGAIHYFRIHPDDWHRTLHNLKALGFNTVETYVPWNAHEPIPQTFDFTGGLDVARFLDTAAELGLWAIVRPSPFICAEWEFGGMPSWLLRDRKMRPRSADPRFLERVASYYDKLMPILVERQVTHGGNIIMMQVENEYGSYCEDKDYLRALRDLMVERGVDVPLCTSDGPWRACLRAGSLIDDDILATGNFGSKAGENFAQLHAFHQEHGKTWPLMCMEFWDGWFAHWGEEPVRRDPRELAESVGEALQKGSVCLYMFRGGTNFGFMNGCSARHTHDLHQVSSYDYDAPLDEAGNPTEKYFALRDMVHRLFPDIEQGVPITQAAISLSNIPLAARVGLFEKLNALATPQSSQFPKTMEDLGQSYGYTLYRTSIERDASEPERLRVIDARDRAQVFVDEHLVGTQYQEEIGQDIRAELPAPVARLDVLVENMGRVNYGHKLLADTQRKGIRTGVCVDLHFVTGWDQYCLSFDDISAIDWEAGVHDDAPTFSRYDFSMTTPAPTYVDLTGFGKGVVFVNGTSVGRFWDEGPIMSLYVPEGLLRAGENSIVVFETEGHLEDRISLRSDPAIRPKVICPLERKEDEGA